MPASVTAQQQDVVAALLRDLITPPEKTAVVSSCCAVAMDATAIKPPNTVRATVKVMAEENDPSPTALLARVCKPPSIHNEHNPSQTDNDNPDLECLERGSQRDERPVRPSAG